MFTKVILPIIAAVGVVFATVHVLSGQHPAPGGPTHVSEPPRNPFARTVAGSGVIEPETENIAIGAPLPGIVVEVLVRVGDRVKTGTVLFRLDDRQSKAELGVRQAQLVAAQAQLERLDRQPRPEEVPVQEAVVSEAEANMADMEDQLRRTRELFGQKVVSANELVTREQAFRAAKSRWLKAESELGLLKAGAWLFDKTVSRAAVDQAKSQVEQQKIELDRLQVRALVDGEVLQVNVRPGEFVGAPANQALVVLGNVQQLHARVDIDENDIPRFRSDAAAKAMLKGQSDPARAFPLKFVRVEPYVIPKKSLTGENAERVDTRVLQVIYSVDARGQRLFVGQQLDVYIDASNNEPTAAK
ncbi:MAG: biotin/lipoyl-binding protein [Planctomycetes bacterium]|nr:biotin/lipoyl-binding protein [Planctomycetota bacterium]